MYNRYVLPTSQECKQSRREIIIDTTGDPAVYVFTYYAFTDAEFPASPS